jgi:hypothetical protein
VTTRRRIFELAMFIACSWVLSSYLFRLAHEVVGHLGTAALFDAEIHGFSFFPGAAVSSYRLPASAGALGRVLSGAAGLAVQIATGIAAILIARREREPRPSLALFLLVYAVTSLGAATTYLATGLYHEWGDPVGVVAAIVGQRDASFWRTPLRARGLWLPFALAAPLVATLLLREYAWLQERWLPTKTLRARMFRFAAITALAASVAGAFRFAETKALPAWTGADSGEHGARLAQRRAIATLAHSLHTESSRMSVDAAWQRATLRVAGAPLIPERPWPIAPLLVALQLLGACLGVALTMKRPAASSGPRLTRPPCVVVAALAAALLGVLFLTSGRFFLH